MFLSAMSAVTLCLGLTVSNPMRVRRWLEQLAELQKIDAWLGGKKLTDLDKEDLLELKRKGFSDTHVARVTGKSQFEVFSRVTGKSQFEVFSRATGKSQFEIFSLCGCLWHYR